MKICLTTFVQGHLYQEYLPMLIYSIGKAYPEYDVKIFLHDTLRDDLRPALDMIRSFRDSGTYLRRLSEHELSCGPKSTMGVMG